MHRLEKSLYRLLLFQISRFYLSPDTGSTWIQIGTDNSGRQFTSLIEAGGAIFGSIGEDIFRTKDMGVTWTRVVNYPGSARIVSLATDGTYLFASTEYNGMWKSPLAELLE